MGGRLCVWDLQTLSYLLDDRLLNTANLFSFALESSVWFDTQGGGASDTCLLTYFSEWYPYAIRLIV